MQLYPIFKGAESVGTAEVETQGLYYKILCHCNITGRVRLVVRQGSKQISLGLCVPYPEGMGIHTKIPVRIFSKEDLMFCVEEVENERFLPVSGKEPISCLDQIMHVRFAQREGVFGFILPESVPQDSDQNP